jgi:hypothetical protein
MPGAVVLTPNQRRTERAREALAAKFPDPEVRSQHYRNLAAKSNAGRVTLTATEAKAVADAFRLLSRIAGKLEAVQR